MKTSTLTLAFAAVSALAGAPNPGSPWRKTLFLDDFTGAAGSGVDRSKWIVDTGTGYPGGPPAWGTWEVETYTSSTQNLQQSGSGQLLITPRKDSSGKWTSARIETVTKNFQAPVGGKLRVEARIKMPNVSGAQAAGYWPAFWALGGAYRGNYTNWPGVGELDIMENVNGVDTVGNVIHCDVNPGGICQETNGLGGTANCVGSRCPGYYHTYALIIDRSVSPQKLQFLVDGNVVRTVSQSTLGKVWNQTVNQGFFLLLNVAIGGSYPNAIYGSTTPTSATVSGRSMGIDYVAVWST